MKKFFFLLLLLPLLGCEFQKENDALTYSPNSTSYIHFDLDLEPSDTLQLKAETFTLLPRNGNKSDLLTAVTSGDYYLPVTTDRNLKAELIINEKNYNVILFPNDTTHIKVEAQNPESPLTFFGKGKAINEYLLEKKNKLGYTNILIPINKPLTSKATYHTLKQTADQLAEEALLFLDEYTKNKKLPQWFVDYERAETIYAVAAFKTEIPKYNELFQAFKDTLPENYFDYLEKIKINNETALLSSKYFGFLDTYFMRNLPVEKFKDLAGYERRKKMSGHIIPSAKQELSGQSRKLFLQYQFGNMLPYFNDSLAIDSLAHVLEVADRSLLANIAGTRSKETMKMLNLQPGDTIPEFYLVDKDDRLIAVRSFEQQLVYINFWASWCKPCVKNIPALNEMIKEYEGNENIRFVNICLDSKNEEWLSAVNRFKLQGINLYANKKWSEKLKSNFNVRGIPHYVIVKEGNVLHENFANKAPAVKTKLDQLLKNGQLNL